MAKLPLLRAMALKKILEQLGFELVRQRGSHMLFLHKDGRTTVIPNHPGEKIRRGLLVKIIKKDLKMTKDEFLKLV